MYRILRVCTYKRNIMSFHIIIHFFFKANIQIIHLTLTGSKERISSFTSTIRSLKIYNVRQKSALSFKHKIKLKEEKQQKRTIENRTRAAIMRSDHVRECAINTL